MTMLRYDVHIGNRSYRIELEPAARSESVSPNSILNNKATGWKVRLDGREFLVDCLRLTGDSLSLLVDGKSFELRISPSTEILTVFMQGKGYECAVRDPRSLRSRQSAALREGGEQKITALMPGKVVRVLAQVGESIKRGQGIIVIEAMKMQNEVRAPKDGILKGILPALGKNVNAGEVLAVIE
ncbi:MAG TPA: biotin/lipoyl-containing protein [Terriglobales bacterium]|nr:biotin/lipoyl-containing protein [Terriglobales bacterium]